MDREAMISLVIPVYNEEANLSHLIERLRSIMQKTGKNYEIIFVDDGSRDNTLSILKSFLIYPEVRVIELTRNYGQHAAIFSGFSVVRGDIVITLDADLQNPPEEIPNLVRVMEEGDYDVVGTIRKERKDSIFRTFSSRMINAIARKITKVNMSDWGCMLRAYRRNIVERMVNCHEHSTFIPALATYFSKKITEIEVVNLQFDLVSSFSDFPLKFIMYAGIGMAFLGISFGVFLGIARIVYGAGWAAEGVFTLFSILFAFVGFQFFALGVMGEYIGRIYREVRKRPEYMIERIYPADENRRICVS